VRAVPSLAILLCLACLPAPALGADPAPDARDARAAGAPDSTHAPSVSRQIWTHFGLAWLAAPHEIASRYNTGIDVGLSAERGWENRIAARLRADYHDLPSKSQSTVVFTGSTGTSNAGHGWLASGEGDISERLLQHLWLEAGLGGGYFDSGYPYGSSYYDPVSGETLHFAGSSGWGGLWSLGTRYEIRPDTRARMLVEVRFLAMNREGDRLRLMQFRLGYRAF